MSAIERAYWKQIRDASRDVKKSEYEENEQRIDRLEKALERHHLKVKNRFWYAKPAIGVIIAACAFLEVSTLDLAIELETRNLTIEPEGRLDLPRIESIESLSVSGLQGHLLGVEKVTGEHAYFRTGSSGELAIESWSPSMGSPILLQATEGQEEWQIFDVENSLIPISVSGSVQLNEKQRDFQSSTQVTLEPQGQNLSLGWIRKPSSPPSRFLPLTVKSLETDLKRNDLYRSVSKSGILSATIHFTDFPNKTLTVRRDEFLKFRVVEGEVTELTTSGDSIYLRFVGRVDNARVGYSTFRSIHPSLLEHMWSTSFGRQIIAAAVAIFSVLSLAWKWYAKF